MSNTALEQIDKKIDVLIYDKTEYGFDILRQKVQTILQEVDMFLVDGEVDNKAIDLYLKNVIKQRNHIKQRKEEQQIANNYQSHKYTLIEAICKKFEFETQEEVIQKLEELEKKTIQELKEIESSL